MKIKIKIAEASRVDLGIEEEPFLVDFYVREGHIDAFFVAEDEIVLIIGGNEFTTPFEVSLANRLSKLMEE